MPWFGRKKTEPPPLSTAAPMQPEVATGPTGELACWYPGCARRDGLRCSYQDRRGNSCETQWCPDHYHLVDGVPYCRRHLTVARALSLARQTLAYVAGPDIDNRAPSLCDWVGTAIDPWIEDVLAQAAAARPGSRVVAEPLELVIEGTPRMRYWDRSWKLLDHTGPLAKLAIRVSEEDDRTLIVMVGHEHLVEIVPPWVDRSASDDASRQGFYDGIVRTLSRGLDEYLKTSEAARQGYLPS